MELTKVGMNIENLGYFENGYIHKIYWEYPPDNIKKYIKPLERNGIKYSWPFIDLFTNIHNIANKDKFFHAEPLQKYEYPLKNIKIDSFNMKIPTNGYRSYKYLLKQDTMIIGKEQLYSHKYMKFIPCIGDKEKKILVPNKNTIKYFLY